MGCDPAWYSSAFGAHLTWTLPFGLLIMFAVFNRFDRRYEEAARDLGATSWQTIRYVVVPILLPSLIGVGLFGFTLSYDEFARSLYTAGTFNTLPLEIYGMTTNVTTPVLYALGTVTTGVSLPGDRAGAGLDHHRAPPPRAPRQRRRQGGMTCLAAPACCGWRPPARRTPRRSPRPSPRRGRSRDHRGHRRQDRGQRLRQRFHPRLRHPGAEAAAGRAPDMPARRDREAGRHRHVGRHRGRAVAASAGVLPRGPAAAPAAGAAARHRRRPDARLHARGDRPRARRSRRRRRPSAPP